MSDKSSLVAQIVAAYASRPDSSVDNIVSLALKLSTELGEEESAAVAPIEANRVKMPIVSTIKNPEAAISAEKVVCLCCGKSFKMLKRHLGAAHNMSEVEYRDAYGLTEDYPLVAPNYSERKARYARSVGFGKYDRNN